MRYVSGTDLNGAPIDVRDPFAERLRALSEGAAEPEGKVAALLSVREIFPPALAGDAGLRAHLAASTRALERNGARAVVSEVTR